MAKKPSETVKILRVFKDGGDESVYVRSYGYEEIEISDADLKEHGKVISKGNPDMFDLFVKDIEKWCRKHFDI